MDEKSIHNRLSQISTRWTLVAEAHGDAGDADTAALTALLQHYQSAVYRYLLGATGDPDAADGLFQDFALKLVRGDYRRATANRGRFRDFLRTSLINLITNYRRRQNRLQLQSLGDLKDEVGGQLPDLEADFLNSWRKGLIERAWDGLAAVSKSTGSPMYAVLRLRTDEPQLGSAALAERLTQELRPSQSFTDTGVRKILQRARELFTDLLLDEVARSINTTSLDALEQEIIDLGFQAYCKRALERRRQLFGSQEQRSL